MPSRAVGRPQSSFGEAIDDIVGVEALVIHTAEEEVEQERARHERARRRIHEQYQEDVRKAQQRRDEALRLEDEQHAEFVISIERSKRSVLGHARRMAAALSCVGFPRQASPELAAIASEVLA